MNRWHLKRAAVCVARGGVIAYPTEAVWGLGCDPYNASAVQRILALKHRPADKGLIVIAARFEQLLPLIAPPSVALEKQLGHTWPGPVTWLLPARPGAPKWLRGRHPTLAVRVTAHPLAAALCRVLNTPLVSTSANPAGRPPARDAIQVRRYFPGAVDYIVPGSTGHLTRPTEIRDALTGGVVRAG